MSEETKKTPKKKHTYFHFTKEKFTEESHASEEEAVEHAKKNDVIRTERQHDGKVVFEKSGK